ncbi:MAG TPA: adenylate/guanylate cyclase domain-containing protein [Saprospiraceae bacterium]|nr:adenylate/guanylate cyclase domain-containing protein [Saprospiraceae bacterium]
MVSPTVKSLLRKKGETVALLESWQQIFQAQWLVEDATNIPLFGAMPDGDHVHRFAIVYDNQVAGYVWGDDKAKPIADMLSLLLNKEAERKRLGTEVLQVYQELNVIYNFSEKLIDTIDPEVIARVTLEQAIHSIPSESGIIVLRDEQTNELNIPVSSDNLLFDLENLHKHKSLMFGMGLSGHSEIMGDLSEVRVKSVLSPTVKSVIYAALKVKQRILGTVILVSTKSDAYTAAHLKLLVTLTLQAATAIEAATLYEKNLNEVRKREEAILRIHEITKKFVPSEFIQSLGKEAITDVRLGDLVEKNVTVLFTDIRDFTSLSERMTPEQNFRFVSSFNERLGPVIRQHHGFINQYLGDSIMALFPREPGDALKAAIGMQKAIFQLNEERAVTGDTPIKAGIGMHTGKLIMGITGDESRLDAATISDTVNTAARIESLTKYYRTPLLLSNETLKYIPVKENFYFRKLGEVLLKGKNKHLLIVECLNGLSEIHMTCRLRSLHLFEEAILNYQQKNFEHAFQIFSQLLQQDPEDWTALIFKEKAFQYLKEGVSDHWTGAEEILFK